MPPLSHASPLAHRHLRDTPSCAAETIPCASLTCQVFLAGLVPCAAHARGEAVRPLAACRALYCPRRWGAGWRRWPGTDMDTGWRQTETDKQAEVQRRWRNGQPYVPQRPLRALSRGRQGRQTNAEIVPSQPKKARLADGHYVLFEQGMFVLQWGQVMQWLPGDVPDRPTRLSSSILSLHHRPTASLPSSHPKRVLTPHRFPRGKMHCCNTPHRACRIPTRGHAPNALQSLVATHSHYKRIPHPQPLVSTVTRASQTHTVRTRHLLVRNAPEAPLHAPGTSKTQPPSSPASDSPPM